MLRIYLVQNLYDLSDMATVAEVIDSRAFSEFCGVESSNQVPDGDTLGRFRNLLLRSGLQEKLFAQVVYLLQERGLLLKKGTIVDSTLIAAPSSTKNREKNEDSVYGDSGYLGAEKREDAVLFNTQRKRIRYKINRRPSQSKHAGNRSRGQIKRREKEKSSVRAKVEHVFGVVKGQLRYRKTRYRGLRKQIAKLNILFALANLILADRRWRIYALPGGIFPQGLSFCVFCGVALKFLFLIGKFTIHLFKRETRQCIIEPAINRKLRRPRKWISRICCQLQIVMNCDNGFQKITIRKMNVG